MARTTLPGHALAHNGSAVDDEGLPTGLKDGPAACACGEVSDPLSSNGQRRAWHRSHVAQARAELAELDHLSCSDPYA